MKIVLAFDSFKGSLSAVAACRAADAGLARISQPPSVIACPLSDGGEGFAEALGTAAGGIIREVEITGPLFERTHASYALIDHGACAVIESAQACGLGLVPPEKRSPLLTTSYGIGELMLDAQQAGVHHLVIGLGGSSTNDAGLGLLTALGWQFLDAFGAQLPPTGASLSAVQTIIPGKRMEGITITAACDVSNLLYGANGAAYTFAGQKGASEIEIAMLDRGLTHFAEVCQTYFETDAANEPGAGAAGGLGFALRTFLGAEFQTGASLAFHLTHFSELLEGADLCITGEGQTDFQTAYGKLPAAVANACVEHGVPCVCLSGSLGKGWQCLYDQGFAAIFSLCQRPETLEQAMQATPKALADAAEAVCRLFTAHSNSITTGA